MPCRPRSDGLLIRLMSCGVPIPVIQAFTSSQFLSDQRHGLCGSPRAIGPCVSNCRMVGCGMASAIMTISTASDAKPVLRHLMKKSLEHRPFDVSGFRICSGFGAGLCLLRSGGPGLVDGQNPETTRDVVIALLAARRRTRLGRSWYNRTGGEGHGHSDKGTF